MKNKKIFIIFLMIAMLTVISLFIYGRSKQRNNYETEKIQEEQNLEIVDNTENEINKDEPKEENNEIKEDTNSSFIRKSAQSGCGTARASFLFPS